MMGQSKNDFLNKGIAVKKSGGSSSGGLVGLAVKAAKGGGGWGAGYDSLPRAKMWIEFPNPTELMRVAEIFGVKAINKRGKDYVFAMEGTIFYAQD